jgi:hypothetical protein
MAKTAQKPTKKPAPKTPIKAPKTVKAPPVPGVRSFALGDRVAVTGGDWGNARGVIEALSSDAASAAVRIGKKLVDLSLDLLAPAP